MQELGLPSHRSNKIVSGSMTDHASHSTPHEFPNDHKYSMAAYAENRSDNSQLKVLDESEGATARLKSNRVNSSPPTKRPQYKEAVQMNERQRHKSTVDFNNLALYDRYNKIVS